MRSSQSNFLNAAFASVIFSALPCKAQDRFEVLVTCSNFPSHVEQRNCLNEKVKESLAELEIARKSLMSAIAAWDQDQVYKDRARAMYQAEGAGFVEYAGKQCEAFAALAAGGNSQEDRRLACHYQLNRTYILQTNRIAASLK
jgi:hypothetical protein